MFDLKRPCVNCPFRVGVGSTFALRRDRLDDILAGPAFQCHKTVVYHDEGNEPGERPQQCAGLMAVLHRDGVPNQIMQVAERLIGFDPTALDPEREAYGSIAEAISAHADGREPKG